jgi:succinate dehydrogenase/fumarate reductase cytochrome b subunit
MLGAGRRGALPPDWNAPAPAKDQPVPAALRAAHGISALVIIGIFLALHITNHLTGLVGPSTYDAVMKIFRHVYRTEVLQPLLVTLFLFQIGTGLYLVCTPRRRATASVPFRSLRASISPFTCSAT